MSAWCSAPRDVFARLTFRHVAVRAPSSELAGSRRTNGSRQARGWQPRDSVGPGASLRELRFWVRAARILAAGNLGDNTNIPRGEVKSPSSSATCAIRSLPIAGDRCDLRCSPGRGRPPAPALDQDREVTLPGKLDGLSCRTSMFPLDNPNVFRGTRLALRELVIDAEAHQCALGAGLGQSHAGGDSDCLLDLR